VAEGRKVPRIDFGKYRGGRAAGRREAVAILGDSLREFGCVRVQGHLPEGGSGAPADAAALRPIADGVLEALADYFGLSLDAFGLTAGEAMVPARGEPASGSGDPDLSELAPVPGLLVLVPEVAPGVAVRGPDGSWLPVSAHPGELLAVSGAAVASLTAGRIPAAGLRWPRPGPDVWVLPAREATAPLDAFRS
jgi:hypothetical protein